MCKRRWLCLLLLLCLIAVTACGPTGPVSATVTLPGRQGHHWTYAESASGIVQLAQSRIEEGISGEIPLWRDTPNSVPRTAADDAGSYQWTFMAARAGEVTLLFTLWPDGLDEGEPAETVSCVFTVDANGLLSYAAQENTPAEVVLEPSSIDH
ncbi:protease inhibitor I42 family protein [Eubacteriales bacterium OttesenSCG-928-A19]|nr:protease inhibitor I42 family protein [Eubacteriales bacterium OttesenSCG-928-A19]